MLNDPGYFWILSKQFSWLASHQLHRLQGFQDRKRAMAGYWQKRNFQKANTTPLIEIRNSAVWWLNYTHTHTDARYLLPFMRVVEKLRSIVQLEIKKEDKSVWLLCLALPPGLFHHHRTPKLSSLIFNPLSCVNSSFLIHTYVTTIFDWR